MPDVHDTPMVTSFEREHVLDRTCWCKPEVLRQPSGDDLVVHSEVTWDDDEEAFCHFRHDHERYGSDHYDADNREYWPDSWAARNDGPAHNPEYCGCEAEIACLCPCRKCNPPALGRCEHLRPVSRACLDGQHNQCPGVNSAGAACTCEHHEGPECGQDGV